MFLRITHKIILTGSINLLGIWDILIAQISLLFLDCQVMDMT